MKKSRKRNIILIIISIFLFFAVLGSQSERKEASPDTKPISTDAPATAPTVLPTASPTAAPTDTASHLTFTILDVGQGLSILAETNGHYLLFDGGDRDRSSFVVSYLKTLGVTKLDYLIASHYDADHLNGLLGALNVFEIGTVIGPDYVQDSKLYRSFIDKTDELNKTIAHPAVGSTLPFENTQITFLAPKEIGGNSNDNSIAVKLTNGNNSFIITGDAGYRSEANMIESGIELDCDVLVLGHHGSATATSYDFLEATLPEYAVISCGKENQYGHPDKEIMEKLEAMEIEIFRTDKQGTIIGTSDGTTVTWNQKPCNDYSSGITLPAAPADKPEATAAATPAPTATPAIEPKSAAKTYILNKNTKKFHYPSCSSADQIKPKNYGTFEGNRDELISRGYDPCKRCNP